MVEKTTSVSSIHRSPRTRSNEAGLDLLQGDAADLGSVDLTAFTGQDVGQHLGQEGLVLDVENIARVAETIPVSSGHSLE